MSAVIEAKDLDRRVLNVVRVAGSLLTLGDAARHCRACFGQAFDVVVYCGYVGVYVGIKRVAVVK